MIKNEQELKNTFLKCIIICDYRKKEIENIRQHTSDSEQ